MQPETLPYKLYLFDVDGTLVRPASGKKFRATPDDWELLPGRAEMIQQLKAQGASVALVTNQGGVGFGYFTAAAMNDELERTRLAVAADSFYVCFSHPTASIDSYRIENDDFRKPGPGMLQAAMQQYGATQDQTIMIGDRPEDQHAAENARVDFQWADQFFHDIHPHWHHSRIATIRVEVAPSLAELEADPGMTNDDPRYVECQLLGVDLDWYAKKTLKFRSTLLIVAHPDLIATGRTDLYATKDYQLGTPGAALDLPAGQVIVRETSVSHADMNRLYAESKAYGDYTGE